MFLGMSYYVISSTHMCGHVSGRFPPARCAIDHASSKCEAKCTLLDLCIAYSDGSSACIIMTSSGSCPKEWEFISGYTATHIGDLTTSDYRGFNCKAKGIE